ncbi:Erich2 [Phodopus roborovskii]|uniref:Erich2 protein n=1 Tax=Phodopus roborovskii TaxID=109678 RepID=A0AAU9Z715_PHORO|nr:Erich2 [Phodopus roborovskii]
MQTGNPAFSPSFPKVGVVAQARHPCPWSFWLQSHRNPLRTSSRGPKFQQPHVVPKTDMLFLPQVTQSVNSLLSEPRRFRGDPNPEGGAAQVTAAWTQKEKRKDIKCCFVRRPRLASNLYSSPTQISLGVANTFSAKKEASSKKIEDKVSSKSIENRPSSRSIENKDVLTNRQSDLWLSSFLKESAGEAVKDAVLAKQERNSEHCLQDLEEKLSDSTDDDGDDDTNDEDDEVPTKKETRAPLELMAEFLRAEMGRDYQLAKKLCQMILIYEPENPVAKEFFSLIEEILLKEKSQKHEEDEEDSEEDTSSESEAESSEDASDDSSDECEDGS